MSRGYAFRRSSGVASLKVAEFKKLLYSFSNACRHSSLSVPRAFLTSFMGGDLQATLALDIAEDGGYHVVVGVGAVAVRTACVLPTVNVGEGGECRGDLERVVQHPRR